MASRLQHGLEILPLVNFLNHLSEILIIVLICLALEIRHVVTQPGRFISSLSKSALEKKCMEGTKTRSVGKDGNRDANHWAGQFSQIKDTYIWDGNTVFPRRNHGVEDDEMQLLRRFVGLCVPVEMSISSSRVSMLGIIRIQLRRD